MTTTIAMVLRVFIGTLEACNKDLRKFKENISGECSSKENLRDVMDDAVTIVKYI